MHKKFLFNVPLLKVWSFQRYLTEDYLQYNELHNEFKDRGKNQLVDIQHCSSGKVTFNTFFTCAKEIMKVRYSSKMEYQYTEESDSKCSGSQGVYIIYMKL